MIDKNVYKVNKSSGLKESFMPDKLRRSLGKTGANEVLVNQIITEVESILYEGITTREIYQKAFNYLKKHSVSKAGKYKLKNALLEMGPSGYPFERYIARLMEYEGFIVKVDQVIKGYCVQHEVDVIAKKDGQHFMVECKFHNRKGHECNVKIPLYIHSRFLDIEKEYNRISSQMLFHKGFVFTNTRFTDDAIKYGICAGLELVGWDYPKNNGLEKRIDTYKLYPITCLTSLTFSEKQELLKKDIVLCKDLIDNEKLLLGIRIKISQVKVILEEAFNLCNQ